MVKMGLKVGPGDFAENLTTKGIHLHNQPKGTVLHIGDADPAMFHITQIGKECHSRCAIYHQAGDCMVFAEVIHGGAVSAGDSIRVVPAE